MHQLLEQREWGKHPPMSQGRIHFFFIIYYIQMPYHKNTRNINLVVYNIITHDFTFKHQLIVNFVCMFFFILCFPFLFEFYVCVFFLRFVVRFFFCLNLRERILPSTDRCSFHLYHYVFRVFFVCKIVLNFSFRLRREQY